jgi:hypothetical protein
VAGQEQTLYLIANIRKLQPQNSKQHRAIGSKGLPGTKTLAYFAGATVMKTKSLESLKPGLNVIKCFSFLADDKA